MNTEQKDMIQFNVNVLKEVLGGVENNIPTNQLSELKLHLHLIETVLAEVK